MTPSVIFWSGIVFVFGLGLVLVMASPRIPPRTVIKNIPPPKGYVGYVQVRRQVRWDRIFGFIGWIAVLASAGLALLVLFGL